jgi:hypothetical protein
MHAYIHTYKQTNAGSSSADTLPFWVALIFSRPRDTDGEFRLRGGLTHVFAHESEEDITSLHPPSWTHDVSMWMPPGLTDGDVAALWERDELVRIEPPCIRRQAQDVARTPKQQSAFGHLSVYLFRSLELKRF